MIKLNIKTAVKRYNSIMGFLGYEHNQIDTLYSENTENWNLGDMVAECDYVLSTYYEYGHVNEALRHSQDLEERKMWKSETCRVARFIKAYEPFIQNMQCITGHCSIYDN